MSLRTHGGHITLPVNRPIRTVESLHKHLQAAMAVELSTIPLYLYAMYSVTPSTSDAANAVHGTFLMANLVIDYLPDLFFHFRRCHRGDASSRPFRKYTSCSRRHTKAI